MNKSLLSSIWILLFSCLLISLYTNCNPGKAEYSRLEKYYKKNTALHADLFDSLTSFCKTYHTDVILRKSNSKERAIMFSILFRSQNTYFAAFYDSAFVRHDPDSAKTSKFNIPFTIIKRFSESTYRSLSSDSVNTFFGGKWDVKFVLGTQGDSQFGILMSKDTSITARCDRKISANVCLTTGVIP